MAGNIGELTKYRLIEFSISNCVFPSYIVSDQKAFTGGYLLCLRRAIPSALVAVPFELNGLPRSTPEALAALSSTFSLSRFPNRLCGSRGAVIVSVA